jgi:hypothetical protein
MLNDNRGLARLGHKWYLLVKCAEAPPVFPPNTTKEAVMESVPYHNKVEPYGIARAPGYPNSCFYRIPGVTATTNNFDVGDMPAGK